MKQSFSPDIPTQLRQIIAEAGGNEVFFRGHTDDDLCVDGIEVLARGSQEAVPAILQELRYGDVVIHNHPSGVLTPSGADVEIASRLGGMGIGFFIIDNNASRVYRVVEPFRPAAKVRLEPEKVAAVLAPGGAVATALPGYEDRPEQLRMAFAVGEAFNHDRLAVVEAGTGTGKSLAYLVPAILWATQNDERVVISTNTINLQEQLIRKDIPFLQRAMEVEFRAELVKGRGNYLCLRKLDAAGAEPGLFDGEKTGELAAIRAWAETTGDGSKEDLSFLPGADVWEEVCCEADQCNRARCGHFSRCFLHKARRRAAQAQLLVVNHALLLSDLALRAQTDNYSAVAVLPPFDRIVLDEAHHLEDAATGHFTDVVTRFGFGRVLGRLRHPRKPDQGLLPRLLRQIGNELSASLDELFRDLHGRMESLIARRQQLYDQAVQTLETAGEDLAALCGQRIDERWELRQRLLPQHRQGPGWANVARALEELADAASVYTADLRSLLRRCEDLPETVQDSCASTLIDLASMGGRLELLAEQLRAFLADDDNRCAWFEVGMSRVGRGQGLVTRLCCAPLEVADSLDKGLYRRFRTVVMTSATLTVDRSFAYFAGRVGLDRAEKGRLQTLLLASPFDYPHQALVAIPDDIPEPGAPGYAEAVRRLTAAALAASGGRSFVLFTAYELLRRVHGELAPALEAAGVRCLRQGEDGRHRLLKTFRDDETSVLFGTDSFWEGVDVPGRALEQVIITRLPFRVPTEPVLEARAEAIERRGGDAFMGYSVPQAVIRFKQGFGRLIRHRDDRGVVLILDSRVVRKRYGRIFLRSLPDARQTVGPADQVLAQLADFFRGEG